MHPQIRIDAVYSDPYVDLVSEGFDVAIRLGILKDNSNTAMLMAPSQTALYAAPGYLLSHGTPLHLDDLSSHACLRFTSHDSWPEWVLLNTHPMRHQVIRADDG